MFSSKPQNLRSEDLYCYIMQYLAFNTGKVVTPSLITTTINKCLCCSYTTNKTVSHYLREICKAQLVYEVDREYINSSSEESNKLRYNRTYYFADYDLFARFYDSALNDLFRHKEWSSLSRDTAIAKMLFYHKCINAGYQVKSGVLSFFTHLENGKTKKNTLSFDFVVITADSEKYVVFQNNKDFDAAGFTIEAKFALQNIIKELSVLIITTSSDFISLDGDSLTYASLDEILADTIEI